MGTVVSGIAAGYRDRSPRLHELAQATDVIGPGRPPLDWRLAERLDLIQSLTFGARPVGWLVGGVGAIVLAGYDLLRRIPIPVVRDFAARKMIDSFLIDWFGDLPVLLDEPVQSANVRARLARSIQRLVDDGCDAIVIVAHSGGALVSFETLLDPAYEKLKVDKLVTLGQGLGLAWRLAADPGVKEITPGHRLVGNLARIRPGLRWVDVWASYDPAPAGPLPARGGIVAGTSERAGAATATAVATGDSTDVPWLMQAPVTLPGEPVPTPPPATIMVESPAGHQRDERPDRSRRVLGEPGGVPDPAGPPHRRGTRRRLGVAVLPRSNRPHPADRVAPPAGLDAGGLGLAVLGGGDRHGPRADPAARPSATGV